jgi:hypothetical protein
VRNEGNSVACGEVEDKAESLVCLWHCVLRRVAEISADICISISQNSFVNFWWWLFNNFWKLTIGCSDE